MKSLKPSERAVLIFKKQIFRYKQGSPSHTKTKGGYFDEK